MSESENFTLGTTRGLAAFMRNKYFPAISPHKDSQGVGAGNMAWMLDKVRFSNDMNLSKANRWIGYVQAYLVLKGYCKLNDVKDDTRLFRDKYTNWS